MANTKQNVPAEELTTFGARLRYEREAQNLSRPALASMTDGALSARMIDHLENGTTDATGQRIELLSNILEVDRNWLGFGDQSAQSTQSALSAFSDTGSAPGSAKSDPVEHLDDPENTTGSTKKTGTDRSNRSEKPVTTGKTGDTGSDYDEPVEDDPATMYFDAMDEVLSQIDALREAGLENHPRKVPALIKQARDLGECLEIDDLEVLAEERDVNPKTIRKDNVSDEALSEFILRLIDTAILGMDLYKEDFDTLKAFARKHDIPRPFFGWKKRKEIISDVRDAYWEKALEGGIGIMASLRDTG